MTEHLSQKILKLQKKYSREDQRKINQQVGKKRK